MYFVYMYTLEKREQERGGGGGGGGGGRKTETEDLVALGSWYSVNKGANKTTCI